MMNQPGRFAIRLAIAATAVGLVLLGAAMLPRSSRAQGPSLGQLNAELGAVKSRQQSLSASLASLSGLISSLEGQIALVESREAAVRANLVRDEAELASLKRRLVRERHRLVVLRARLSFALMLLSRQLVSNYESDPPDLVSVVLESTGFNDLLERIDFLQRAEQQQQTIIQLTRVAKAQATAEANRLAALEATERRITKATAVQLAALAGMNELLQSRELALQKAQAAQQTALAAARARGAQLQSAIAQVQAQQAAAERAAAAANADTSNGGGSGGGPGIGPALGPGGGWSIPYSIVLCESGGQNDPPNSAGASGYYQIIPSTWALFGGTGPAAYLASKAEQDAVAARIWNGGAGASNWVCAGIVGIT